MYAIINRKTGKFLCGTDYRYRPPHQITSDERLLVYDCLQSAEWNLLLRGCNKDYKTVPIKVEVIEE